MAKQTNKPTKRVKLYWKINEVTKLVPKIKCEIPEVGDEGEGTYYYTEAAEVFLRYSKAFMQLGLTFLPVPGKSKVTLDGRFYKADMTYELTDVDTGYSIFVFGSGLGGNWVWSANTAQTVTRKQALLNTFGCSYGQPESAKKTVKRLTKGFKVDSVIQVMSGKEATDEMLDYFGNKLKEKENVE